MAEDTVMETDKENLNPFKDKNTVKVQICEPSAGMIDCQVYDNRIDMHYEMARLEARSNFKFFTRNTGRMGINAAREAMGTFAVQNGMDYLLMIDDDQTVPPDLFERLYKTMEAHKADIVSPMVTQRISPFKPVMWKHSYCEVDGNKAINCEFITDYEPDEIVKADAVGFGVVLMRVDLLKKVPQPWFFSNNSFGEDIWFCMKAKGKAGAKVLFDTSIKCGHMRPPECATEWDYVKSMGWEQKFSKLYGHLQKDLVTA